MSLARRDFKQVIPDRQPSTPSEASFAKYTYKPIQDIDEIRLLRIEPGPWNSNPQCTLSHYRLPECPPFEALSYVWGSEEKPCKIGCGEGGTLAVTRNCFAAIKRLRRLSSLVVWIDAVCIDQENNLERGHQVKNMPDIYKSAAEVFVYLGETEDRGDEAMETLRFSRWKVSAYLNPLRKLLQRPWFERIWVLQEVNKARTVSVICGDQVVPWNPYFRLLVEWDCEDLLQMQLPYTLQIRGSNRNTIQSWDVLELLEHTRSYKCTDPRDRIFALLSMCSEGSRCGIEPDYTATVEEVYARAAMHFLKYRGLDVLAMVDHGNQVPSHLLPSWAPDWRVRPNCTPFVKASDCHTIRSSGGSPYFFTKNSLFLVHGRPFGMLHNLGQVFEPDDSGWDKTCIDDWWGRLFWQCSDAVPADLIRILRMSTSDYSGLFTPFRTTLRSLIQSIAHTVLSIVQNGESYRSAKKVGFQSDCPKVLCSNAFLGLLGNPQLTAMSNSDFLLASEGSEQLQSDYRKYGSTLIALFNTRFERVSYSEIMCDLKNVLLDEIYRRWLTECHHKFRIPRTEMLSDDDEKSCRHTDTSYPVVHLNSTELDASIKKKDELHASIKKGVELEIAKMDQEREALWEKRWLKRMRLREQRNMQQQSQKYKAIVSLISIHIRQQIEKFQPGELFGSSSIQRVYDAMGYHSLEDIIERIWDHVEPEKRVLDPKQEPHSTESHLLTPQRIHQFCNGRRLFVAEHFTGLAPANAQRGDTLCSLSGSRFPVLLRKVPGHELLIGACYVFGDTESQVQDGRYFSIM